MKILKRALVVVGGLVLLLGAALAAVTASALWGNAALPDFADLPGGARLVKVNDGVVALFVLPTEGSSLALVDCGNDPEATRLLAELARRGARREDVKAIFLTHGHWDHTAGCRQFPGAEVMALAPDVALAAGVEAGRGPLARFVRNPPAKVAKVTRVLQDGEMVQVGDLRVRVFAVPGHTDGSAAFLANGVLFLGDSATILDDGAFAGGAWAFSNSVEQNHASLRALWRRANDEKLRVDVLAPSHSAPQQGTAAFEAFASGAD